MAQPTIAEIARRCFGDRAEQLLRRGAIHPIRDRRNRKAPYVRGVQHGFFETDTRDWVAVGFQAGPLSGMQVLDIDRHELIPDGYTPNVQTARGAHYYGRWDGGTGEKVGPSVDLIRRGNVVFFDLDSKAFLHPALLSDERFDDLRQSLARS